MADIFEFNPNGEKCPICNTAKMKDSCLIPIVDGKEKIHTVQAIQVHVECLITKSEYLKNVDLIITPGFNYKP